MLRKVKVLVGRC